MGGRFGSFWVILGRLGGRCWPFLVVLGGLGGVLGGLGAVLGAVDGPKCQGGNLLDAIMAQKGNALAAQKAPKTTPKTN